MDPLDPYAPATGIAAAVRDGAVKARDIAEACLARLATVNGTINAFTDSLPDRALAAAEAVDRQRASGQDPGRLAGVPFAVKNLFDLAGLPTRAGSLINREHPPAARDAELVRRLTGAGAVCLGALNMGEFAYDFTGQNAHDGACRNPHAPDRMTGGSSSGSGAATAAGLAPVSLGSDTNGSLRVPASLCGVFSLKPTYGRLTRSGTFPFVDSLDHVGPLARFVGDLAVAYDELQGPPAGDPACVGTVQPVTADLETVPEGLRVGVPRGWFEENAAPLALERRDRLLTALPGDAAVVDIALDEAAIGRAAAYLITNAESSTFHLPSLRARAGDYDPETRDRFLAGALLPAAWITNAQRARRWWLARVLEVFSRCDVLMVPATPCTAPAIGEKTLVLDGTARPLRPFLGLLSQPFSCVGLPVVTAPVFEPEEMPLGIQLVAAPWREGLLLRLARVLERAGAAVARPPRRPTG